MKREIGKYLYACGNNQIPSEVELNGQHFLLNKILKHDFFAATALFTAKTKRLERPAKIILKISRLQHFFGIPMYWLGQMLHEHELEILDRLSSLEQVPHPLGEYGSNGLIYEYIEGQTMKDRHYLKISSIT
ncbi:MAG: hypothetical protein ACYSRQ_04230 [Planctomycetota bacterium]|jgi:hypothetical protein